MPVQRGKHFLTHAGGFVQDLLDHVGRGLGIAVRRRDLVEAHDLVEQEPKVLERGAIGMTDPPWRLVKEWPDPRQGKETRRYGALAKGAACRIPADDRPPFPRSRQHSPGGRPSGDGALVAFPTETVYGLGADATDADAVARIFAAKGGRVQPADRACRDLATAERIVRVDATARALAEAFWPGP